MNYIEENKTCQNCHGQFTIEPDDFTFYEKISVPTPKLCPKCRRNLRLAFGNYTTLYQRTNNSPLAGKIISCYPEDAPFPVFDVEYYFSNKHNPDDYFIDYNENEPFLEQFKKLNSISPRPALVQDPSSVNSGYSNYGSYLKNSFYTFGGLNTENVAYSMWGIFTRDTQDVLISLNSEHLYEAIFPEHSYNSAYIYFSANIINSTFMYDCKDCSDCIGCVNLRHKQYCVFNEYVGKDEYNKIKQQLSTGSFTEYQNASLKFWDLVYSSPARGTRNEHSINSTGIYLVHNKNCDHCIWCIENVDCRYTDFTLKVRDSMDVSISNNSERLYNTALTGSQSWNNICTVNCKTSGDCEYSIDLRDCRDCFGCISIDHKQYCIFNKQYTEDEYKTITEQIKNEMRKDGIYGEFFPYEISPFPYNASLANVIYPKTDDEILAIGSYKSESTSNKNENIETIRSIDLPDTILEADEKISEIQIESQISGRPYKIRNEDLEFYKTLSVPLPRLHPYERMRERFKIVNNFLLEDCVCNKCGVKFIGALPNSKYMIYCDKCYNQEIV